MAKKNKAEEFEVIEASSEVSSDENQEIENEPAPKAEKKHSASSGGEMKLKKFDKFKGVK